MEQWKLDAESEDHRARRDMAEKSIARYVKGEMERQITSSSTSSTVFVSDCTWIMSASLAQPSYLCCGLSNGSVCLLNTSNLSKIYLFEADRDPRAGDRSGGRGAQSSSGSSTSSSQQLVAVATYAVTPGTSSAAAQLLLCLTLDKAVCVCPMDMSTVLERRKVSRSDMASVKAYPPLGTRSVLFSSVQFNPKGNRIAAVLGLSPSDQVGASATTSTAAAAVATRAPGDASARYCVAVLSSSADAAVTLQSTYTAGNEWHFLTPPTASQPLADGSAVELCYCGWWSNDMLVCVWSNSALQLLRVDDMQVAAECRLLRHCAADAVTKATVSRPSSTDAGVDGACSCIVAVVLEHNVAATYYVTSKQHASCGEPDVKRARLEETLSLSVSPTMQTYCTEDIPIREVYLFRSFSWTLLVLLESGALVYLDLETMRLSVHRAVNRLRAPDASRYQAAASLLQPRRYFCVVHDKPFGTVVVEHNAAILLKSQ